MWIEVTSGARSGTTIELRNEPITIGRDPDCDLILPDDKASRHHATLAPLSDGTLQLQDLNSTNGTYVNGHRITTPTTLHGGETLRIADTTLALTTTQPTTTPKTTLTPTPPHSAQESRGQPPPQLGWGVGSWAQGYPENRRMILVEGWTCG